MIVSVSEIEEAEEEFLFLFFLTKKKTMIVFRE